MNIKKVKISELNPAYYNPRQISEKEMEKLKASILEFGNVQPLVVNKRNMSVTSGHQRLQACISLGHTEVDCILVSLDDKKEKALNLAMNKISGEWDFYKLKGLLSELDGLEALDMTGFEQIEFDSLMGKMSSDDFFGAVEPSSPSESSGMGEPVAPVSSRGEVLYNPVAVPEEVPIVEDDFDITVDETKETICKLGDIWQLGRHKIACMDSTNIDNIKLLLGYNKCQASFIDPPYNIGMDGGEGWDNIPNYENFIKNIFNNLKAISDIQLIFFDYSYTKLFEDLEQPKERFVWKRDGGFGGEFIKKGYEPFYLYGQNPVNIPKIENKYAEKDDRLNKYKSVSNVWDFPNLVGKKLEKEPHPTQKPISLINQGVEMISKENDIIFDGFLGSGTTLIACQNTNRICCGMELSPHYCQVILERFFKFTGIEPVREDGVSYSSLKPVKAKESKACRI